MSRSDRLRVEAIDGAKGRGRQVHISCCPPALRATNSPTAHPAPHRVWWLDGNRNCWADPSDELAGTVRMLR